MQSNQLLDALSSIRSRVKSLAVVTGLGLIVAAAMGMLLVAGVADYLLNLPGPARLLLIVAALGTLGYLIYRFVIRPATAKLTAGDIAGRVEITFPQFDDRLRSTVNFLTTEIPGSDVMKDKVSDETAALAGNVNLGDIVVTRPLWRSIGLAAVSVVAVVALALAVGSQYRSISFARLLHPFGDTKWPLTVQIVMDSSVPQRVTAGQRIFINMKLARGDKASRKAKLIYQYPGQKPVEELMARDDKGVYSSFHDAKLDADVASGTVKMWIEAGDDRLEVAPITIVPKLSITQVDAVVTPPDYANLPKTTVNLRESPAVMAAGANVVVRVMFNKPLADAPVILESAKPEIALPPVTITRDPADKRLAIITFSPRQSAEFRVKAIDTDEFTNESTESYQFTIRPDQNPVVLIEIPRGNEERTAVSAFGVQAVAEDDYGIKVATLNAERLGDHHQWKIKLVDNAVPLKDVSWNKIDGNAELQRFRMNYTWDLAQLEGGNLQPGDVIEYCIAVTDNFALDGKTHDPVLSGKLRITIISQEQLNTKAAEAIRNVATQVGDAIKAQDHAKADTKALLEGTQKKDNFDAADKNTAEQLANQQAAVASQDKQLAKKLDDLNKMLDENKSPAQDLKDTAKDVSAMLNRTADGPQKDATDKIADAKDNPTPKDQRNEKLADAANKQEEASQQLQNAIKRMGDPGSLANKIEEIRKLLDAQTALSKATAKDGQSALGKKPSDMTPEEKKKANDNADQQKALADQTQKAIDGLKKSGEDLAKSDPVAGQAMKDAAATGQAQQVPPSQQKASAATKQNQQSQAQAAQKQAELGLQMMLSNLQEAEKRKLEELVTKLEELQKQIQILVKRQAGHNLDNLSIQGQEKLKGMEAAVLADLMLKSERDKEHQPPTPTAPALTALQEQTERNTRDIAHGADSVQGASEVAGALSRSATKMGAAIVWLRQTKMPDAYDPPQVEALNALVQAQAKVDDMLQKAKDKQDEAQKDAIRAALQKIRTDQAALNDKTVAIDKSPRNDDGTYKRDDKMQLNGMPGEQGKLQERTSKVGDDLSAMGGIVYTWAVKDVTSTMDNVKEDLAKPMTGEETQIEQAQVIEQLDAMIAALATKPKENPFDPKGSPPPGGSGSGSPPPPKLPTEAELRLLRANQNAINRTTHLLDAMAKKDNARILQLGGREGELRNVFKELMKKAGGADIGPEPDPNIKIDEEHGEEALVNHELDNGLLNDGGAAAGGGGKKPAAPPKDAAAAVKTAGERMGMIRQRLALNNDAGKVTQLIEKKLLEDMDNLIDQARQQQSKSSPPPPGAGKPGAAPPQPGGQGQGKPQNAKGGGQPGKQGGKGGSSPAGDSSLSDGGASNVDPSVDIHNNIADWGGLTPRERQAVLETKNEVIIEKYRNYSDEYYKSLAIQQSEQKK